MSGRKITVSVVKGVGGFSLYVNDIRLGGPKPWGGGKQIAEWWVDPEDLRQLLASTGFPGV